MYQGANNTTLQPSFRIGQDFPFGSSVWQYNNVLIIGVSANFPRYSLTQLLSSSLFVCLVFPSIFVTFPVIFMNTLSQVVEDTENIHQTSNNSFSDTQTGFQQTKFFAKSARIAREKNTKHCEAIFLFQLDNQTTIRQFNYLVHHLAAYLPSQPIRASNAHSNT